MSFLEKTTTSLNPFGDAPKQNGTNGGAIANALNSRAIAEVHAAVAMAKQFPRNPRDAMDKILMSFTRQTLAEKAMYSFARGGSEITGPSIRAAEAIAQHWGNLNVETVVLEQRLTESVVQVVAWDLETNLRQPLTFVVKHERHTKKGVQFLEDPRDIYEMVMNQASRRRRACILAVIPGDVTEAAIQQAETTLATKAKITPERIQTLIEKFAEIGVTLAMLEAKIQRRIQAITPALFVQVWKYHTSITDGFGSVGDYFDTSIAETVSPTTKTETSASSQVSSILEKRAAEVKITKEEPETPPVQNVAQTEPPQETKVEEKPITQGLPNLDVKDVTVSSILEFADFRKGMNKDALRDFMMQKTGGVRFTQGNIAKIVDALNALPDVNRVETVAETTVETFTPSDLEPQDEELGSLDESTDAETVHVVQEPVGPVDVEIGEVLAPQAQVAPQTPTVEAKSEPTPEPVVAPTPQPMAPPGIIPLDLESVRGMIQLPAIHLMCISANNAGMSLPVLLDVIKIATKGKELTNATYDKVMEALHGALAHKEAQAKANGG